MQLKSRMKSTTSYSSLQLIYFTSDKFYNSCVYETYRHGKRRVPVVSFGGVDVEGYSSYYNDDPDGGRSAKFKRLKYRKHGGPNSLRRGLLSVFDTGIIFNCYISKL